MTPRVGLAMQSTLKTVKISVQDVPTPGETSTIYQTDEKKGSRVLLKMRFQCVSPVDAAV